MPSNLLDAAVNYHHAGLCVIPTDLKDKNPIFAGRFIKWKQYQSTRPQEDQVRFWFGCLGETPSAEAIAIVCGSVSGNLEMIDFDAKAALYEPWVALVSEQAPKLLGRLLIERTQSGGLHVVYRCPDSTIPGSKKLSMSRHAVSETEVVLIKEKPHADVNGKQYSVKEDSAGLYIPMTMIETKGQGGYFLCSPSKGYELLQGSYEQVPEITADEREILVECACSLNMFVEESNIQTGLPKQKREGQGLRPGDDYNRRGDVAEILLKHGWTPYVGHTWTRPGKSSGASASLLEGKVFYVFSTSVSEFKTEKGFSPFATYAILEHGGDFSAAGRELYSQGYGDRAPEGGFSKNSGLNDGHRPDKGFPTSKPQWRPPMPLEQHANVPAFPVAIFPRPLADYCHAVAEAAECPTDLVGQTMLGALSATMLGKAEANWGKCEPLGLYLLSSAAPSEHKSTVEQEVLLPLRMAEKAALDNARPLIEAAEHERDILKVKLENAKKEAARNLNGGVKVAELAEQLRNFEIPIEPRLTIEDVTPETLATKLGKHQSLAIFSSEGSVIDNLTNRYSNARSPNYKLYLKAWSGDPHLVDRQNRTERLERPLLTICTMVQPTAFEEIVQHVEGARGLGLLSRFLFAIPSTMVGDRSLDIVRVEEPLRNVWASTLRRLHQLDGGIVHLGPEALNLQTEFARELERRIGKGGDLEHIADWIGKMQRGQSARIAALLHCIEQTDPYGVAVSAATMRRALALCEYYIAHAQRAFEMLQPRPEGLEMDVARRIVSFLRGKTEITNAELTRRFGLRKAELAPYLELLDEFGHIAKTLTRKGSFLVNPLEPIEACSKPTVAFEQVIELPECPDAVVEHPLPTTTMEVAEESPEPPEGDFSHLSDTAPERQMSNDFVEDLELEPVGGSRANRTEDDGW